MKKTILYLTMIMAMTFLSPVEIVQAVEGHSIQINGEFSDWNGQGGVDDKVGDTTGGTDLTNLRFVREDNLLYINLKRDPKEVDEQWNLRIPIINADPKYGTIPVFLPWDEIKDENGNGTGVWPNNDNPTQEVAYLVTISYREDWDPNEGEWGEMVTMMNVTVSLGNNRIDYVYKCLDKNETEFAIDLDWVGLGDDTSEVEFAIGSNTDSLTHSNMDWISEDGPIKVTNGPILGIFTVILGLGLLLLLSIKIARSNKAEKVR